MSLFSVRLLELLTEQDKRQTELANHLGLTKQNIGRYVHDKCEPSICNLIKIANFFNTTIDYLVGKSNEKTSPEMQAIIIERRNKELIEIQIKTQKVFELIKQIIEPN